MNILEDLRKRKILNNITNENKFLEIPKYGGIYIGFDPTAESLHLGNYIQIALLLRFKKAGFNPIAVLGGATGMIGDPSGKSEERILLSEKKLNKNKAFLKKQLESFGLKVVDNYDFYQDFNVLSFLRDVGKLININYMLAKDVVSSRLETGISFTEFTYQLIQGWDFKSLYEKHNVFAQVGGSDQWGNITTGLEIIRKIAGEDHKAVGITTNLLLSSSGQKFGKSAGNAIWLDKSMTSAFSLYQYIYNTPDNDVENLFNWLTFLDLSEISKIMSESKKQPKLRLAQKTLALEVVKDIHSEEEAKESQFLTEVLFGNKNVSDLSEEQILKLDGAIPTYSKISGTIIEVLTSIEVAKSYREANELINNGAIEVNGKPVSSKDFMIENDQNILIKKGKRQYLLIKSV